MSPELLAKYMKAAEGLNITESMIETAYEEGEFEGMEKGMEKGMEMAKSQLLEQMVVNAFHNDLSVKLIAEIVEISETEVKAILAKKELL